MTLSSVIECIPTLRELSRVESARERNKVLKRCKKGCIYYAISEIARNILLGNIPITSREKILLKRYKVKLKSLNPKKTPLKERKEIIQRGGGFLPALLIPALSALSHLIPG